MKPLIHKRQCLTVFACLMFALPLAATAAPPGGDRGGKVSVTAANPSEAFQGEQLTVTVSGSGFDAGSTARYLVTGTTDASQVDVLSVQYISSSELRTIIRPKDNALVTDYDIEVQTYSGRKGKGITLFRVKQTGKPLPPPPTEPEARFWHNFTGNGGTTASASRLYLFGGNGGYETNWMDVPPELWSFSVADANWTVRAWTSSTKPDPRHHAGLSCGNGLCVMTNGVRAGLLKDTWIYTEQGDTWSHLNCKRFTCPSGRTNPAMAYDSVRNEHLLFGGAYDYRTSLDDTYTFSNATGRWTRRSPKNIPPDRFWAAAAFVAGPVNRVLMFGGIKARSNEPLCDMWSWTGNNWEQIGQINASEGPCLDNHSMAWDGSRLVVTGGFIDHTYGDLANDSVWTFTFTADGKAGTWTWYPHWSDYFSQCTGSGMIYPHAQMAYDRPSGKMVFFGGGENIEGLGAVAYDDLNVCQ